MIRKLRAKLIFVSMLSLFLVMIVILGSVTCLDYRNIVTNADRTLEILKDNNDTFPQNNPAPGTDSTQKSGPDGEHTKEPPKNSLDENILDKNSPLSSPELPYESRYFSVILDADGNEVSTDTAKIAAVDSETALSYAQTLVSDSKTKGFYDSYRYLIYTDDEQQTHVLFLDCGRSLSSFSNFVIIELSVSGVGLVAVFFLIFLLSRRMVRPFIENYEKQRQFVTDAGHEIKTPLTVIEADADILEMDYGESEWISDIRHQTHRLTDLTNRLITLARMEEAQPKMQMIDFPLSDLVEETAHSFQSLALTQNKTFTCEIAPMISCNGDEKALRQLVEILLENALKYSTENGTISLTLSQQNRVAHLSVYNTTEHMERAQLAHLFDRFYRTDKSRNAQTGGYGLGLSIAKAVVTAHRGKITATTADEKSLTITVALPVAGNT